MLYPKRFDSANAHRMRVKVLREVTALTKDALAAENPMLYVRFDRPGGRSVYVVDFGYGEVCLEKWQVELFLLGLSAGLAVTGKTSRAKIKEWVELVAAPTENGQLPRPWGAAEAPAVPVPPTAPNSKPTRRVAKRVAERAAGRAEKRAPDVAPAM